MEQSMIQKWQEAAIEGYKQQGQPASQLQAAMLAEIALQLSKQNLLLAGIQAVLGDLNQNSIVTRER